MDIIHDLSRNDYIGVGGDFGALAASYALKKVLKNPTIGKRVAKRTIRRNIPYNKNKTIKKIGDKSIYSIPLSIISLENLNDAHLLPKQK